MSMRNVFAIGLTVAVSLGCSEDRAPSATGPGLGEMLTVEEIAALQYTVFPNGDGLPDGSGDAVTGEKLYRLKCLACHGAEGDNGINDRLVGGRGTLTSGAPVITVGSYWPFATTLFDYIRRAMPYRNPGSLSVDETYALTAYVLSLNGIVEPDEVLDATSLPQVQMPNRDGFVWAVQDAGR